MRCRRRREEISLCGKKRGGVPSTKESVVGKKKATSADELNGVEGGING